jgi:hypothetical protein
MTSVDYAAQSAYSDPGRYVGLLDALPGGVRPLTAVVRNLVVHYRASGIDFPPERLAEVNLRWAEAMLKQDQQRFGVPLAEPRPEADRLVGCCRDFTLLTVAGLRQRGVPARSRVGFARYLSADFHYDHVIAEYWDGARWVFTDAQLDPARDWPFDTGDIPWLVGAKPARPPQLETAAQVWTAYRRGEIDEDLYGVGPGVPIGGAWFIRNYVLLELAHRQRDELLLWDVWGAMSLELDGDLELIDQIAALLLAADDGDAAAERELAARYAADPKLHPGDQVRSLSPVNGEPRTVDLRRG